MAISTFVAAFDGGDCGTCGHGIKQDQEVSYDGTNRLVHVSCPIDDRPPGKICQHCFMELPITGDCGNCD